MQTRLKKQMMLTYIVWAVMTASALIYGALLFAMPGKEMVFTLGDADLSIAGAVIFLSFVIHFLSFAVPSFIASDRVLKKQMQKPWTEDALRSARTPKGYRVYTDTEIPQLLLLGGPDRVAAQIASRYQLGLILTWALINAATMMGYVLAFIAHRPLLYVPFAVIGLASMILRFPAHEKFLGVVRRMHT